jgi:hypothetical protein
VDIKKSHLPVRSIEECESSVMKLEDPNQYDVRLLKSYMRLLPVIEQTVWNTKLSGIYKFPCVTRSKKDWYDFNVSYEQLKDDVETLNNIITKLKHPPFLLESPKSIKFNAPPLYPIMNDGFFSFLKGE